MANQAARRDPHPFLAPDSEEFRALADRWQEETAHSSSMTQMVLHPAYQQIIGKGPAALPFIFKELAERPHHWFWALQAITGEDPIPAESRGILPEMAQSWLEWGSERGYC